MSRPLRSGYTTGACAAAAAKAAALALFQVESGGKVEIPFPTGERHCFPIHRLGCQAGGVLASVIKDAGDDPDVTNGAEIMALVTLLPGGAEGAIQVEGGSGVGRVTKPGLPVAVGEPAINPVPRKMIRTAVEEAREAAGTVQSLRVVISVRDGERLAEKTLNRRLGIIGGLSILGTTGIVRPISARAWTETIETSMKVARAVGLKEVILSTGRTSEAAVQALLALPEEAAVMMGDYLAYGLKAARNHGFVRIHLAGMWAKVLKWALGIPQTHVRHGALEVSQATALLRDLGLSGKLASRCEQANTAREIYSLLLKADRRDLVQAVCRLARDYGVKRSGLVVDLYLVTSEQGVVEHVGH